MTDDTTNIDIEIDVDQLSEYIQQYKDATDREEQREIENKVLAETVWKTLPQSKDDLLVLNERQVEILSRDLPDDAEKAEQILRSMYVQRL